MEVSTLWHRADVEIDGGVGPYEAQVLTGARWNGAVVPAFDIDTVKLIAKDLRAAMAEEPELPWVLVVVTEREDEVPNVVEVDMEENERLTVVPVHGPDGALLWPVGARSWMWQEVRKQTRGNGRYR
jgi:hypothetical protein